MRTVGAASLDTDTLHRKDNIAGKPAERRPKSRKQVLVGGIVAFDGGQRSFDCTIRDLSETGARVLAAKGAEFPPRFYLINIRDRVAYDARPVRSDGSEAGIIFKKTIALSGLSDPSLGFLKRLWLSKATG